MAIRKSGISKIPSGNTAARPASPILGDTYYNGQLEILEIYNGTTWVAISAPPATPSVTSVTDVGTGLAFATGGTFTVAITLGSGGSTPAQFNASTTAGGFSASNATSPISLTGLTPNTSFAVVVNAQNNFGTTVNSAASASVLATTVPQIATIGTATASNVANEVTVTWVLPNNGGKALSAITITPFLNGTTAETSRTAATTSSTSYTFTAGQLTPSAAYTFKVKSTNANGTSADSTATNSATMPNLASVDFLVVAGGGSGGGQHNSAGGGAGGLRSSVTNTGGGGTLENTLTLSIGNLLTITVGAGGPQTASSAPGIGFPGNPSSIAEYGTFLVQSIGGGHGGSSGIETAGVFGSGGGNSGYTSSTPNNGTAGQGFRGGAGAFYGGGGGGGAGAVGGTGTSTEGGNGGIGVAVAITGSSVYYAGGGGGADYTGSGGNPGGLGGGGLGGAGIGSNSLPSPTAGATNLGGGGGGNNNYGNHNFGPAGGSGIVVIKLLAQAASTTGNPSNPSTGLYIFNGDGTITL